MTNEEAKVFMLQFNTDKRLNSSEHEAVRMAIKALEQEPCTDVISRQAVLDKWENTTLRGRTEFDQVIMMLPSVTPQPKMGHWIMKHRTYNKVKHYTGQDEMGETHTISVLERYEVDEPYCSKCGKLAGDTSQNFCCACGAKMVEPQESEVKP